MIVLIAKIALGWAVLSVVTAYVWGRFASRSLDNSETEPTSQELFASRSHQYEDAVVITLE